MIDQNRVMLISWLTRMSSHRVVLDVVKSRQDLPLRFQPNLSSMQQFVKLLKESVCSPPGVRARSGFKLSAPCVPEPLL